MKRHWLGEWRRRDFKYTTGLPEEIKREVEVFKNEKWDLENDFWRWYSNVEPPLVKKQKQNPRKIQDKCETAEAAYPKANHTILHQDKKA